MNMPDKFQELQQPESPYALPRFDIRNVAARIIFDDIPQVWEGDFELLYDIEEEIIRGYDIGRKLVQDSLLSHDRSES